MPNLTLAFRGAGLPAQERRKHLVRVRKAEGLDDGATASVTLTVIDD